MQIVIQDDDASGFITEVQACILGIIRACKPAELFVIKTNNWFGAKWLGFSGKTEGASGVWKSDLTVPPFVPHRVLWERRYVAPNYRQSSIRNLVHIKTSGEHAQKRYISEIAPTGSLVWYSGGSRSNERGAIMAYVPIENSYWAWHTSWALRKSWRIVETSGVTIEEIEELKKPATPSPSP